MENQYKSVPVKSSEITPYSQYLSRRDFLRAAGIVTGSALVSSLRANGNGNSRPCAVMRTFRLNPARQMSWVIQPIPSKIFHIYNNLLRIHHG